MFKNTGSGHSFAYVAHFVFLEDVWIRTQRADVARYLLSNKCKITLQDIHGKKYGSLMMEIGEN
jgi:hypothetical protein